MSKEIHKDDWTDTIKRDKRPQKYGWAPGFYKRTCMFDDCKKEFIGDKRAGCCADCANDETRWEKAKASITTPKGEH